MAVKVHMEKQETEDLTGLLDGINYTGDKGPCFGTRYTEIILMAIGIGIAFATKITFSIILIAMTTANTSSNADVPVYDWDNKGVIIGAVLWSGIPVQILAGYLGKLWGYKWLTLGSNLLNAVIFMLIPVFAHIWGSAGVIFCRVMQGAAQGGLGPLSAVLNGIWVPAEERSKAGFILVIGTVGIIMISSVTSGVVADSSVGWPWCFYIMGIANLIWCVFWYFLAHESPQTHPRITPEEKKYIEVSLNQQKTQVIQTPWLKIISSIRFWAIVVAGLGTDWTATMLSTNSPIYLASVLKMDVKTSGTIMAISPVVGIAAGIFIAPFSDFLIKRKILRCVNARRLFHSVGKTVRKSKFKDRVVLVSASRCTVGNALTQIAMTFLHVENSGWVVLNLCFANIFIICYSVGGAGVNALDISPVFAGIISGVGSTFSQSFALFAPLSVDWIIKDESDATEWRTIFFITAGIAVGSTVFFDIFATDKRQEHWEVSMEVEENITERNSDIEKY